jgi:very-short-patch-repair endonuclease
MGKRFITSFHSSIAKARALRRTMTEPEKRLWALVRNNRFGVKFRRQVPIGPYIVDFFCFSAKLAVELDGSQHYTEEGKDYDFHRDQFLKAYGVTVLRFSNREFLENQDGVMQTIWERVNKKNPSP